MEISQKYVIVIACKILGYAIEIRKHLGSGLLKSVNDQCMLNEFLSSGLSVNSQIAIPD